MSNILTQILGVLMSSIGIVGIMLTVAILLPEKTQIWLGWIYQMLTYLNQKYHKAAYKYSVQGRINKHVKNLNRLAPHLATEKIEIEWVEDGVRPETFIKDNCVYLRVKKSRNDTENFVNAAYMFVSVSLLHNVKRYLSPSQKKSIDLFVTRDLFKNEMPNVLGFYVDKYLHPVTNKQDSKVKELFQKYAVIHNTGMFYPVLLQELDFLGMKILGNLPSSELVKEVNLLIEYMERFANRKVGDENFKLWFVQDYCKVGILIVGKSYKIGGPTTIYVNFVLNEMQPKKIETIYILGNANHTSYIQQVCQELSNIYEQISERIVEGKLYLPTGEAVKAKKYIGILRLRDNDSYILSKGA